MQHGTGDADNRGVCQQLQNPTNAEPLLRALFVVLVDWVTKGTAPPTSEVPRQSTGMAAIAIAQPNQQTGVIPQDALGWPTIPGVKYTGLVTVRYQLAIGQGTTTRYPPSVQGRPVYVNFVSKVDQDGNEVAGIRLPPVAAPVATTTGWALRRAGCGENDGCEGAGQYIPFALTKAARLSANDPRLSLEERYQTHAGYVRAIKKVVHKLAAQRFLLPEDVEQYIRAAEASNVLK